MDNEEIDKWLALNLLGSKLEVSCGIPIYRGGQVWMDASKWTPHKDIGQAMLCLMQFDDHLIEYRSSPQFAMGGVVAVHNSNERDNVYFGNPIMGNCERKEDLAKLISIVCCKATGMDVSKYEHCDGHVYLSA